MGGMGNGIGYDASGAGGGGGGTVTSVGLTAPGMFIVTGSPVTTAGSLDLALANQDANKVFAGPLSGGAAVPTFRALVPADIPALPYSTISGLTTNMLTKALSATTIGNSRIWDNGTNLMGFNTTSVLAPGFQFHVAANKNILFYTNSLSEMAIASVSDGGGIPPLCVDGSPLLLNAVSGGNVGIKISTNPTEALQVAGNITASGTIYAKQFFTNSVAPAITLGVGAGSGAFHSLGGTNQAGVLTITAGTGATAFGDLFEFTYSGGFAYPNGSLIMLTPISTAAATLLLDSTTSGTTTTVKCRVGATPPGSGTILQFAYIGAGY